MVQTSEAPYSAPSKTANDEFFLFLAQVPRYPKFRHSWFWRVLNKAPQVFLGKNGNGIELDVHGNAESSGGTELDDELLGGVEDAQRDLRHD